MLLLEYYSCGWLSLLPNSILTQYLYLYPRMPSGYFLQQWFTNIRVRLSTKLLTEPPASPCVDLPELDAFLQACWSHGTLAVVGLAVAGTQRLIVRGARLRQAKEEGLAGDRLHPAHLAQAVLIVFAWVCGDQTLMITHCHRSTACSTIWFVI